MKLEDQFVVIVQNHFKKDFCTGLIEKYNDLVLKNFESVDNQSICKNGSCPNCDCLRVNLHQHEMFKFELSFIANELNMLGTWYRDHLNLQAQFPKTWGFEHIKIKRYLSDGKQGMLPHIDVTDSTFGKRFLSFVVYLNEDFVGGNTLFHRSNMSIKPSTGTVVMFPPYWPWLHSAEPVTSGSPKYFLGSYLHYTL